MGNIQHIRSDHYTTHTLFPVSLSDTQRTFVGGCYDPVVRTTTVGGECLDDRHCVELPNTQVIEIKKLATLNRRSCQREFP